MSLLCQKVLFDIEKSFDRVWQDGLIHNLHILDTPIQLSYSIDSYLQNRLFKGMGATSQVPGRSNQVSLRARFPLHHILM